MAPGKDETPADAPAARAAPPPVPGFAQRLLDRIERVGNALPHPAVLFALLTGLVVLLSAITSRLDLSVAHPGTGAAIRPVNLLSVEGLHRVLDEAVRNFTSFAPLGVVLVAMLGIGVAEHAGFVRTVLRALVLAAPRQLLTAMVFLAGILSHVASDVGYVVVVPLAGLLFLSAGRHPLVGLAAAFAGVSGGFSANLVIGPTDALLAGITQEAAHIVAPGYVVTPAANWYFMASSALLLTLVGTLVTERFVAPRLGEYRGPAVAEPVAPLDRDERRGLRFAVMALGAFLAVVAAGVVPQGGLLRSLKSGGILDSPLLTGVVAFIFAGACWWASPTGSAPARSAATATWWPG
jgi:aminobenzoyl-glutamate transport protein